MAGTDFLFLKNLLKSLLNYTLAEVVIFILLPAELHLLMERRI